MVTDVYQTLYDARVNHTKNVKLLLTDHLDSVSNLIILAANEGLTCVDSAILLEMVGVLLKKLSNENKRFEGEMTEILNPKGQSK